MMAHCYDEADDDAVAAVDYEGYDDYGDDEDDCVQEVERNLSQ